MRELHEDKRNGSKTSVKCICQKSDALSKQYKMATRVMELSKLWTYVPRTHEDFLSNITLPGNLFTSCFYSFSSNLCLLCPTIL